jgi:hypothetical protein
LTEISFEAEGGSFDEEALPVWAEVTQAQKRTESAARAIHSLIFTREF